MSELTRCNHCTLQSMRRRARARGETVVVQHEANGEMRGWTSVRYSDRDKPSAYFLVLTTHCVC